MSIQAGRQPFHSADVGDAAVVTVPDGAEVRPEEGPRKATVR
ncbi:hypothetical protein [Kitasatospora sp. NPDC006786]